MEDIHNYERRIATVIQAVRESKDLTEDTRTLLLEFDRCMQLVERLSKARRAKAQTVHGHYRAVSRMFNVAVSEGYLDKNPAAGVRLPKPKRAEPRIPNLEQVQMVLDYLKLHKRWLYRICLTLVHTACRLGEALTLTWDAVDFTQEKIILNRRKVNDELKIPMAGPLKEELFQWWVELGMPKQGSLFVSRTGKALIASNVLFCYKPVVRSLGMDWMTLKVFRKFAATSINEVTGDVRMVQQLLGHTSVQTTELYLGRGSEARKKAVKALEAYLAGQENRPGTKTDTNRATEKTLSREGEADREQ